MHADKLKKIETEAKRQADSKLKEVTRAAEERLAQADLEVSKKVQQQMHTDAKYKSVSVAVAVIQFVVLLIYDLSSEHGISLLVFIPSVFLVVFAMVTV